MLSLSLCPCSPFSLVGFATGAFSLVGSVWLVLLLMIAQVTAPTWQLGHHVLFCTKNCQYSLINQSGVVLSLVFMYLLTVSVPLTGSNPNDPAVGHDFSTNLTSITVI